MAGKVVDFDPSKRLSKEALDMLKDLVARLQYEETRSLTVIFTPKNGIPNVAAYGLDFESIGIAQTMLTTLGQEMLAEAFSISTVDKE